MIDSWVAHYHVTRLLGAGGMGEVFQATDTRLGREVALKFLPGALAEDARALERFQREMRAASSLSHPNIATIYDVGEHEGRPYLVMELLEGETLARLIADGPLSLERLLDVARQMAAALASAHEKGIIHRDIKPANVILTPDGRVKLLDFGLVKHVTGGELEGPGGPDQRTATLAPAALTSLGEAVGTVAYMSPEQARGEEVDRRTDIFSFGCLLYEATTGRRPFVGATAPVVFEAILNRAPVAPRSLDPAIPARLEAIILRALEKDRERRYPDASVLRAELEALAEEYRTSSGASTPVGTAAAARRGRRWLLLAAGGAALVVLGLWIDSTVRNAHEARSALATSSLSVAEPLSADPEANEYFEKGMLFLRAQFDPPRAQQMLARAIEIDPSFGTARAIYALTFVISIREGYSNDSSLVYRAEREAREAISLQPDLPSAHAVLGAALLYRNRKEQAREEFRTALRLDPTSQAARVWSAVDAYYAGRYEEAGEGFRNLAESIPLFFAARLLLADVSIETGRMDEARREIGKVFEQDPRNLSAIRSMARLRMLEGDLAGARVLLEGVSASTQANYGLRIQWVLLLAREGQREAALAALDEELLKYGGVDLFTTSEVAEAYSLAGESDTALDWLDRSVRNGDERADWFASDPFLAGVRQQPRFRAILEAMRSGG